MRSIRRRCFPVATLLLIGGLTYAGRVTATFPLPNPVSIRAFQQDTAGNVYFIGNAGSAPSGSSDVVVAKLSSTGTVLFWTTFGGSGDDYGVAMAIAADGSINVTGTTTSLDFPVTPDAAQAKFVSGNASTGF